MRRATRARTRGRSSAATRRCPPAPRSPAGRSTRSAPSDGATGRAQKPASQARIISRPEGPRLEDVRAGVARAGQQPVGEQHAEQRHEERAEHEQERLVLRPRDQQGADRGRGRSQRDQQALRHARQHVLERDGRRVDVRERLVGLVHGEREQREPRGEAAGRDGRHQLRGIAVGGARRHQQRAEGVEPRVGTR